MRRISRLTVAGLALSLFGATGAMAQGTLTVSRDDGRDRLQDLICTTLTWTTNSSGEFSQSTTQIRGNLLRVVFDPAGGSASPEANYDLVLTDRDAFDVLGGAGANLSQSATTDAVPTGDGLNTVGPLTLTVTNASDERTGMVRVFHRP